MVSLKDKKQSEVLYIQYSLLGIQSVVEVVRRSRLGVGIWNVKVEMVECWPVEMWRWGEKSRGRGRKTWSV